MGHVILTIVLVDIYRDYISKSKRKIPLKWVFYGGVAGLLPDIDVPFHWIMSLFVDLPPLGEFHRTLTHSIFFILLFVLIALILSLEKKKIATLAWIVAFGVSFHIFLDMIFAGYVTFLYPLSHAVWGLDLAGRSGIDGLLSGLEAIILLLWLWHEQVAHRITDYI